MAEQSAKDLGLTLVGELLRLRVETLVSADQDAPALEGVATAVGAGLPPTDLSELIVQVRDRVTAVPMTEGINEAAPAPSLAQDEVAVRQAEALRLLDEIDPRPEAGLESVGGAPPAAAGTTAPPQIDQNTARALARHWELGQRPVACRTLVRMDGDSTTQFPADLGDGSGISQGGIVRAHGVVALAAIALWPLLFGTAGSLVAAVIPQRPGSSLRRRWKKVVPTLGTSSLLSLPELINCCRRFLAWGRVVFESPGSGSQASIRSMVHPSGDIETTVLRSTTDDVLIAHAELVATWLGRLARTLHLLDRLLDLVPIALWILLTGTSFASWGLLRTAAVAVASGLLLWPMQLGVRWWLRRRLTTLLQPPSRDRIETPRGS